jgi:hypothetical protein
MPNVLASYYCNEHPKCAQIFQKSTSYINTVGVRTVVCGKFHTKNPQILGMTTQNLVAQVPQLPVYVHTWYTQLTAISNPYDWWQWGYLKT